MVDKKLFILVSIMIGIGIILVYTLSSYVTIYFHQNQFHYALRQLAFGFLGITIMSLLAQLDSEKWLKIIGLTLFFTSTALMSAMPFLPENYVSAVGGAKRWIKVFGFSLAPVEFFKVGFIYFLAWSFSRKLGHHGGMSLVNEFKRFLPYGIMFLSAVYVIAFVQNDLGQVVVLSLTLLVFLALIGSSFRFFGSLILAGVVVLAFAIFSKEHRIDRILSWWSLAQNTVLEIFPEFIAQKLRIPVEVEPYQIGHSLNAIHHGGFFGTGLANGTFKLGFLSEVHTDFILAGLVEEFGFFGILFVVYIFLYILLRIFKIANRAEDRTVYLFSVGVGLMLSFAFLVNAYGISGLIPIKGIAVPFLSYGGSTTIAGSIAIGMVLMASKKVDMENKL